MLTCILLIFSLLFSQGSDEHDSEETIASAITDEKREKLSVLSTLPKYLPFAFLEDITDGFSKERQLGRGGFGVVYKVCQHPCVSCSLCIFIFVQSEN
jgi:hypothetical protein